MSPAVWPTWLACSWMRRAEAPHGEHDAKYHARHDAGRDDSPGRGTMPATVRRVSAWVESPPVA
jgi:hypothetical protein